MVELNSAGPRRKPPHEPLSSDCPAGWRGGDRVLEVMLTYAALPHDPATMVFQFVVKPINYPDYKADPAYLDFGISADCTIRFTLDEKVNWRWSHDYWVISAKEDYRRLYGDVQKISDRSFEFKAKYDEGGNDTTMHHFNLNIDYGQGAKRWLPITIDPDVGNPRPHQLNMVDGPILIVPSGEVSEE
jgi:hypothetical protein